MFGFQMVTVNFFIRQIPWEPIIKQVGQLSEFQLPDRLGPAEENTLKNSLNYCQIFGLLTKISDVFI
jgi:hypothetical protein